MELTDRQFSAQPWVYGTLILGRGVLFIKDGPLAGNPRPYGELYRPTLKAVAHGTISFSGIEPVGKVWAAQVWQCETYNTGTPPGASKKPDGTLDGPGPDTA
ncbi:MAG: hypothetical protein REJ24_13205 [Rhodocyclaceae bacterium]|nr:hypothetical protein [Pseudomonadota bacterium]MDQ7973520.1 hypothetical protein [Rhodocyclaceae bacterium]MDQ7998426.1 hypothetical protein [Pseudomonadota bacterium]MDQ8016287.1 hypothetical protein [Pseudomonadota bacterium]